jgi:acetyl-CoA acetyltransferase
VNTSGGLLARRHPISATGLAQIVEVVLQLRGALARGRSPTPAADRANGPYGNT